LNQQKVGFIDRANYTSNAWMAYLLQTPTADPYSAVSDEPNWWGPQEALGPAFNLHLGDENIAVMSVVLPIATWRMRFVGGSSLLGPSRFSKID